MSRRCDIFNLAFHRRTNILRPVGDTSKPEDICLECMAEGASDTAKYRREQYGLYQVPGFTPSTTRHTTRLDIYQKRRSGLARRSLVAPCGMQHIPRDTMVSTFAAALNAYAHATSTPDEPAVAATAPVPTEPAAAPADAAVASTATTQQPSPTAATTVSTSTTDGDVDNHSGTGDAQPTAIALPDANDGGRSRWLRMAAMPLPELTRALQASDPAQPTVATRAAIKSVHFLPTRVSCRVVRLTLLCACA